STGQCSKTCASPMPTMAIMKAKPSEMPSICGMLRRKPKLRPEASTMALLGPGVMAITKANTTSANRRSSDMAPPKELTLNQNINTPTQTLKTPAQALEVIQFWSDAGAARWFAKDDAFDAEIRSGFLRLVEAA